MDITCARCRRPYFVPDDLVRGRTFRVRCSHCQHSFAVEVSGREGGRALAAPKSDLKATAASAIPGFAEGLEEELGWLDDAAKEAEEDEYVLRTVRRARRVSGATIAVGAGLLILAVAGVGAFIATRPKPNAPARRGLQASEQGSAPVAQVSGLAFREPPAEPARAPAAAPAQAPAALPAPTPAPAQRPSRPRISIRDPKLLYLLAKKQDVAILPPAAEGAEDAPASATSALDPAAAGKVLAANRRAFDTCVSRSLRVNPSLKLAPHATLIVTVQPSGMVSRAYLAEDEVDRSDLGTCLIDTARRMVFPSFEGEAVEVAMPLSLSAGF